MKWKSQNLQIKLAPKVIVAVGQAALDTIKEQASAGVSSSGDQLEIDWRRSGDLMDTANVSDEGLVQFPVPYAEIVEERYPFAGISPQYQDNYDKRLELILQVGLVFEKEG